MCDGGSRIIIRSGGGADDVSGPSLRTITTSLAPGGWP